MDARPDQAGADAGQPGDRLASRPGQVEHQVDDWRNAAACRREDPELFFSPSPRAVQKARSVCVSCPVRIECLMGAIASGDRYGVRGGLTPRERRALPAGLDHEKLTRILNGADPADPVARAGRSRARRPQRPDQLLAMAVAVTDVPVIPPDADAAEHRAVLLRELAAFHAEHPGELLAERRRRPAADLSPDVLRHAHNQMLRARRAGLSVPSHVTVLVREHWRRTKKAQRQTTRGDHRAA